MLCKIFGDVLNSGPQLDQIFGVEMRVLCISSRKTAFRLKILKVLNLVFRYSGG